MAKTETEELKDGYIFDYISGEQVKATPEEIEAVQVFSKQLVEDYGYSKDQIQTRPQYRVKANPNKELLNKLADYQKELAIIYADAWFEEEKAKALQQAKGLYLQANQPKSQPKLEDTLWKQKGATDKIEYFFLNGSLTDNELRYFENNKMNVGKWSFNNSSKDEISIDLLNNKVEYLIVEIKDKTLKLKDKTTNDILEFEKV